MRGMAVGFRVDGYWRYSELSQRADNAASNHAAIRDQDSLKHQPCLGSQMSTRIGVGLYALQGLFNCGQLLMRASTSISARSSTYLPGPETPSRNVRPPCGVTGTFMKKLMFGARSRFSRPRPQTSAAFTKLCRHACM